MIHLKSFINFINEGAWYEGNEENPESIRALISLKNDFNNPNELLTTPPLIGKNYSVEGLGNIKVYYGLYPYTPYSGVRGENGDPESQRAKRYIMNNLKRGNPDIVSMSTGETLENFIEKTLINNLPSKRVDYIVGWYIGGTSRKNGEIFVYSISGCRSYRSSQNRLFQCG